MQRLGVLGGSFDPIHYGHLAIGEAVREELQLDRVLFIPAGQQPFKRHGASAADRLALVAAAVQDNPLFGLDDLEIQRDGPSYTVDTMTILHQIYPNSQWWFILGSDALSTVHRWHEIDRLAQLTRLAVVRRPGSDIDLAHIAEACPAFAEGLDLCHAPALELSSTELRERVGAQRSIRYLVPEAVRTLIHERGLYLPKTAV